MPDNRPAPTLWSGRRPDIASALVLALVVLARLLRGEHDLPGEVVAVLLCVEPAPLAAVPQVRNLGAEESLRAGIAVRDMDAGDLVVALVRAEAAGRRVERRRRIAPLSEPAHRLEARRVVLRDVPDEAGVERLTLRVERVAGVLDKRHEIPRKERHVVETGHSRGLGLVEERQVPAV